MTTAPVWLDEAVAAFGRQMQLPDFRLNGNGAAAVRFENGINLSFEYADGSLVISTGVDCRDDAATLRRLLTSAHWANTGGETVRAAYLSKSERGIFLVRLPERAVTVTRIGGVFNVLWQRAEAFRRAVA